MVQLAVALELVVIFVGMLVVEVELVEVCTGGSGTLGLGHVTSLTSSGQNSLIL